MALLPTTRRKRRRRRRTGKRKLIARGRSRASRPRPRPRPRPRSDLAESTDEDYRIGDEEEEEEDSSGYGSSSPSSEDEDIDTEDEEEEDTLDHAHARPRPRKRARQSRPSLQAAPPRPRRRNRRPQASSDEDFVIDETDDAGDADKDDYSAEVVTISASSRAAGSSSRNTRESVNHNARSSSRISIADLRVRDSVGRIDEGRAIHTGTNDMPPKDKGKDKVIEEEETKHGDDSAPVCGVCLSQEDVVERGKLDCCDHFFCFGCIMEWAKVESRCPMCKQRFVTVVRAGNGKSKRTRTVRIPLRNQVYIPPEEDAPVAEDPYADVVCMECHEIGEESLLLLCDHCDSAAHTYCVGLGRSVPHGDWFCRSCQALIAETFDSEDQEEELVLISSDKDEDYENDESVLRAIVASSEPRTQRRRQRAQGASTSGQGASTSVTISLSSAPRRHRTGVRGRILRRLSGQRRRSVSAPRLSQAARALMREAESINRGSSYTSEMQHPTQPSSARTVPGQRRLQERIQIMRNDWGRIQTGALPFEAVGVHSTSSTQGVASADNRNSLLRTSRPTEESAAAKPNSSRTSNLATAGNVPACSKEHTTSDTSEIEQAWRMMDHAKTLTSSEHTVVSASTSRARPTSQCAATNGISSSMKRPEVIASAPEEQSKRPADIDGALTNDTQSQHISSRPTKDDDGNADELRCATIASAKYETAICMQSTGSGDSCEQPALIGGFTGQMRPREGSSVISAPNQLPSLFNSRGTANGIINRLDHESNKVSTHGVSQKCLDQIPASNICHRSDGERPGEDVLSVAGRGGDGRFLSLETEGMAGSSVPTRCKEDLKGHIAHVVKKHIWPFYLSEGLGKEQFKHIAKSAVHMLLDLCRAHNENPASRGLTCAHVELHATSVIVGCCNGCFNLQVEKAVRAAKAKVRTS